MRHLIVLMMTITAAVPSLQTINFFDENEVVYLHPQQLDEKPGKSSAEKESQITFILFTRTALNAEILTAENVAQTTFNPDGVATKFIIHGYRDNGRKDYINETARMYLHQGDMNVISVEWSPLAGTLFYNRAVRDSKIVGKVVGELISRLHHEIGLDLDRVHILGPSLGAHTAGFSGKKVIELTGKQVSRITGLDPAGPLFELPKAVGAAKRLDKSDAKFVDVIHSDGGAYGSRGALGHIDFYPNGGLAMQPGCSGLKGHSCSHMRAYEFFAESIVNNNFVAQSCKSWTDFKQGKCEHKFIRMGEYLSHRESGTYFLVTNSESPYAKVPEKRHNLNSSFIWRSLAH